MTQVNVGQVPGTAVAGRRMEPGLYRRRVAADLRKARLAAGLTQPETAGALEWSVSKLMRIEAAYARALLRGSGAGQVEERVDLLLARQELLDFDDGPDICYVLDEAILHRCVGGLAVMAAQMDRLSRAARHPRVSLRVLPFTAGYLPSDGSFTLIDADGAAVYYQAADGRVICSRDGEVADRYRERLACMRAMASQPAGRLPGNGWTRAASLCPAPEAGEEHDFTQGDQQGTKVVR